jgi:predicted DNA repair protein MutK
MLWVGGSILVHGFAQLGYAGPEHLIHDVSAAVVSAVSLAPSLVGWLATSVQQAVLAIIIGAVAVAAMGTVIVPIWRKMHSRDHD